MRRMTLLMALGLLVLAGCAAGRGCRAEPVPATPSPTLPPAPATWTATATATMAPSATPEATRTPATPFSTPTGTSTSVLITATPTARISTATPFPTPEGEIVRGYASAYAEGVFERVIAYHVEMGYWEEAPEPGEYAGYVALESCEHYRGAVWLRPAGTVGWQRFLVADCAGDEATVAWMQANNIIVELDWGTWLQWRPLRGPKGLAVEMIIAGE